MLKTTLKISIAVAMLATGSMAREHGNQDAEKYQGVAKEMGQFKNQTQAELEKEKSLSNFKNKDKEITVPTLTDIDKTGIIYMVEEEKVARDVYNYLAEKWEVKIFSKISESEQKHIDAVTKLFSKYDVELPMTMDEEGIFSNEKLQEMYNSLIEKGEQSLEEALKVGVEIEETDIEDLEELLEADLDKDVEKVYSRILKGSYNHLRSFNRQLDK